MNIPQSLIDAGIGAGVGGAGGALVQYLRNQVSDKKHSVAGGALTGALGGGLLGGFTGDKLRDLISQKGLAQPNTQPTPIEDKPTNPGSLARTKAFFGVSAVSTPALKGYVRHAIDKPLSHVIDNPGNEYLKEIRDGIKTRLPTELKNNINFDGSYRATQSAYEPFTNNIRYSNTAHPGLLAHEAGHALRGSGAALKLNYLPKVLMGVPSIASLATKDENSSLALNGAASALAGVTLYDEFKASQAGAKLMRAVSSELGHSGIPRSTFRVPYRGLPTYAFNAATPLLMHYARKGFGGFQQPEATKDIWALK